MLETGGKAVKAFGTEEQVVLNAPSLLCRSGDFVGTGGPGDS